MPSMDVTIQVLVLGFGGASTNWRYLVCLLSQEDGDQVADFE